MLVPVGGALTGWAALRWYGGRWFDGTADGGRTETPVSIASPGACLRPQRGITVCRTWLRPDEIVTYDGLRLTTPALAAAFAVRRAASLVEGVVAADMAAFSDLASIEEMVAALDDRPGAKGNAQARRALALAHENSWSPMESRLRLVAGLPPLVVNAPVFDLDGRHLGTPDLLDVEAGLAIEYDGAEHHGGTRRLVDSRREDGLREAGLSYLTVLGAELHDHARLAERLRRARARAMAARSAQCWTVEPPTGWVHLDSVASRRRSRPWPDP